MFKCIIMFCVSNNICQLFGSRLVPGTSRPVPGLFLNNAVKVNCQIHQDNGTNSYTLHNFLTSIFLSKIWCWLNNAVKVNCRIHQDNGTNSYTLHNSGEHIPIQNSVLVLVTILSENFILLSPILQSHTCTDRGKRQSDRYR